jgi:hypothetical protein
MKDGETHVLHEKKHEVLDVGGNHCNCHQFDYFFAPGLYPSNHFTVGRHPDTGGLPGIISADLPSRPE